jgi:hypothetical protein
MGADVPLRTAAARLGSFSVQASPESVRQFSDALCVAGARRRPGVPLTFPMRWLALPEIRNEIVRSLSARVGFPVQESQTFEYTRTIELGGIYRITIELLEDDGEPERVRLCGVVHDPSDMHVVTTETTLRFATAPSGTQTQ